MQSEIALADFSKFIPSESSSVLAFPAWIRTRRKPGRQAKALGIRVPRREVIDRWYRSRVVVGEPGEAEAADAASEHRHDCDQRHALVHGPIVVWREATYPLGAGIRPMRTLAS